MKLYIWTGFCPDVASGLAFAIARDEVDARKQVEAALGYEVYTWGNLEVRGINQRVARCVHGGG